MPAVRLAALSIRVSGSKSDGVSRHDVPMNIKTASEARCHRTKANYGPRYQISSSYGTY